MAWWLSKPNGHGKHERLLAGKRFENWEKDEDDYGNPGGGLFFSANRSSVQGSAVFE